MAEYKNGVNFRGNMSVEADDISPEVKTGRVVFVDEDLYESNEEYKAKVDKCVEEGFMRSDEAGSGGSSGGGGAEPLIVSSEYDDGTYTLDKTFGEIRGAFESGRTILVVVENTSSGLEKSNASVIRVAYAVVNDDPTSTLAEVNVLDSSGSVMTYSVHLDEAPYTLDALDAKYPSFINQ